MDAGELRRERKLNPAREVLERTGWYHSFRFEDGTEFRGVISVEKLLYRYSQFPFPHDLTGKTVLDIGAWDGWFAFETERRGARVTAIDTVEFPNFRKVHSKLQSRVDYREFDLFEIPDASLGKFDYVLLLGVLYHTKHPVLALEIVCSLTEDLAIIESYVIDADSWRENGDEIPVMEFYETDELAGQLDNWCGPTVGCFVAMVRTAGFARIEILSVEDRRAALACYRKWEKTEFDCTKPRPLLISVKNNIRSGINFRTTREEYMTWTFEYPREGLVRQDVRLEVSGYGVPAMYLSRTTNGLYSVNSRLPPGLAQGWHAARLSVQNSAWSEERRIAVDLPLSTKELRMDIVCDGITWERGAIDISNRLAYLSVWVKGLGETSDEANTKLFLGNQGLNVTYVGEVDETGARQVNATVPADLHEGEYVVTVQAAGEESAQQTVLITKKALRNVQ